MKLAIVGSRNFTDYELFKEKSQEFLLKWKESDQEFDIDNIVVVSGGAKGTDSLAEQWADEKGYEKTIFYPDWKRWGRGAGLKRNTQIVEECTHMIAFPSKSGRGTQDSIRKEQKGLIPIQICWYEEIKKLKTF